MVILEKLLVYFFFNYFNNGEDTTDGEEIFSFSHSYANWRQ